MEHLSDTSESLWDLVDALYSALEVSCVSSYVGRGDRTSLWVRR